LVRTVIFVPNPCHCAKCGLPTVSRALIRVLAFFVTNSVYNPKICYFPFVSGPFRVCSWLFVYYCVLISLRVLAVTCIIPCHLWLLYFLCNSNQNQLLWLSFKFKSNICRNLRYSGVFYTEFLLFVAFQWLFICPFHSNTWSLS
jgi:hypothetical protein